MAVLDFGLTTGSACKPFALGSTTQPLHSGTAATRSSGDIISIGGRENWRGSACQHRQRQIQRSEGEENSCGGSRAAGAVPLSGSEATGPLSPSNWSRCERDVRTTEDQKQKGQIK